MGSGMQTVDGSRHALSFTRVALQTPAACPSKHQQLHLWGWPGRNATSGTPSPPPAPLQASCRELWVPLSTDPATLEAWTPPRLARLDAAHQRAGLRQVARAAAGRGMASAAEGERRRAPGRVSRDLQGFNGGRARSHEVTALGTAPGRAVGPLEACHSPTCPATPSLTHVWPQGYWPGWLNKGRL